MDYEDELKKAYESFHSIVKDTAMEGYSGMLGSHINEMEKCASRCQFSEIAEHMRELGEEDKSLDTVMDELKRAKTLTDKNEEEIGDKLVEVWRKLDLFIANELVENCGCRMRGINY